jgi:hypothetical protein
MREEIEKLMAELKRLQAREKEIHRQLLKIYKKDLEKNNGFLKKKLH